MNIRVLIVVFSFWFNLCVCIDANADQRPLKELDYRLFKNLVEGYASDGWGIRDVQYFSFTGKKLPSAYSYAEHPANERFVQWTTAKVPSAFEGDRIAFAIPCGLGGEGGLVYGVPQNITINGKHQITIHASVEGDTLWRNGEVWAFFKKVREDRWGDPFGILFISLPRSEFKPGEPAVIKVISEPQEGKKTVFFLITKYSQTIPYIKQAGGIGRFVMMSGDGAEPLKRPPGSYCLTGNAPTSEANRNIEVDGQYTYFDGMTDSYDFPYFEPHEKPGRQTNYDESMLVGGWIPFKEGKITDGDAKTAVGIPAYRAGVRGTDYVVDLGKEFQIDQIELLSTYKGMRNISVYLKSEADALWVLVNAVSDRPRFVSNPFPKLAKMERLNVSGSARWVRINVNFESYVAGLRELQVWGRPLKSISQRIDKIAFKQDKGEWRVSEPQEIALQTDEIPILPIPQELTLGDGYFTLTAQTPIYVLKGVTERTRRTAEVLAEDIKDELDLQLGVQVAEAEKDIPHGSIVIHPVDSRLADDMRPQGYQLNVDSRYVHIRSQDEVGVFYATQTLMQMPVRAKSGNNTLAYLIRACEIRDWPVKTWRVVNGNVAPTKELLKAMARLKTTDYAFGVNSQDIIDIALASNSTARDRFIKMIPTAQFIGASSADPESYVERAPGEPLDSLGVGRRNPCPSTEGMWESYFSKIDKLGEIYGDYVNVGMDEMYQPSNGSRWNVCERCRARNLTGHELMADTIRRIHGHLAKYGKKPALIDSPLFIKGISNPEDVENDWRKAADLLSQWGLSKDIWVFVWHVRDPVGQHLYDTGFKITHWSHSATTVPIEDIYLGMWLDLSDGPFSPQYIPAHAQLCWSPNRALPDSEEISAREQPAMAHFRKIWSKSNYPSTRPNANFFTIDLKPVANRGLTDDVPFDGKGWADLGPNYDLRALKHGKREFAGVPFEIIDETVHNGRGAVMVHNRSYMNRTLPDRVEIPVDRKAASINFLHTLDERPSQCYQVKRELVGYYFVVYEDGTYEPMEIKYGINICNFDGLHTWWDYAPKGEIMKKAVMAWKGQLGTGNEAVLYRAEWVNPYPERVINRIIFASTWKPLGVNPILLAVTGTEPTQRDLDNPPLARSVRGYDAGEVVKRVEALKITEPIGKLIDLTKGHQESDYIWRTDTGIIVEHNESLGNRMSTRACDPFWTSAACAVFDNNQWTRSHAHKDPSLTITLPVPRTLTGILLTCGYRFEDYMSDFQAKAQSYRVSVSQDGLQWRFIDAKDAYIGEEEGAKWIPLFGENVKAVRIHSTSIAHVALYAGTGPGLPKGIAFEEAAQWTSGIPHPKEVFGRRDVVKVPPYSVCESISLEPTDSISFKFLYGSPSFNQMIRIAEAKSSTTHTIVLVMKEGKLFNYVNKPVEGPQYVCEFPKQIWHDVAITLLDSKRYTLKVNGQSFTVNRRYDGGKMGYIKFEPNAREKFFDDFKAQ